MTITSMDSIELFRSSSAFRESWLSGSYSCAGLQVCAPTQIEASGPADVLLQQEAAAAPAPLGAHSCSLRWLCKHNVRACIETWDDIVLPDEAKRACMRMHRC
jgi:hypothetical protein